LHLLGKDAWANPQLEFICKSLLRHLSLILLPFNTFF